MNLFRELSNRRIGAIFCCILALSGASVRAQEPGESALRAALERVYGRWRAAVIARDPRSWAQNISMYRQILTRNLIVSQRKPFPEAVFAVPLEPPAVDGLRLLEAQAVGPTAHLLYFGKVYMGGDPDKIPDAVLMLKFFQEEGSWKFDSSKVLKLVEQPRIAEQLRKGGKPDFLDYPEFTPPGRVPPVQPLCKKPENMAGCTLQSYGYETTLSINGFPYPPMVDQAEKLLVIGGLDNGTNQVILNVRPTAVPKGEKPLLQLDLFVSSGKAGSAGTRVFQYKSEDPALSGTIRLPVVINDEVLKSGR